MKLTVPKKWSNKVRLGPYNYELLGEVDRIRSVFGPEFYYEQLTAMEIVVYNRCIPYEDMEAQLQDIIYAGTN